MIEILFNSCTKLGKHKNSGITRDSKRVFGIFRTVLQQMPKGNLKKHPLYRLTLLYFLTFTLVGNLAHLPESPLSEEKYPNGNPAWKKALLIIDFQGNTRKGSSTSLSAAVSSPFFFTPCCARLFFCCLRKVSVEQRLWTISRTVAAGVKIHLCSSPLLG
jgi:hypothetical protein